MEFQKQARRVCENIFALTGVACTLRNPSHPELQAPPCCRTCAHACTWMHGTRVHADGRHCCPQGFMFLRTALCRRPDGQRWELLAGPMTLSAQHQAEKQMPSIPHLTQKQACALEETVEALCGYLTQSARLSAAEYGVQQEALQTMYTVTQQENHRSYPIEDERSLQQLIRTGNKPEAQKLLNRLLLELYFAVGMDLLLLKLRIRELITLMSRAAADSGADVQKIFALCDHSVLEIEQLHDFDALDAWLGVLLHRFFDLAFDFNEVKHQTVIRQASGYIQQHLTEKLTLEQVARQVHLSKSYLCRILKDELGCTFTEYTNRLRVERSKHYLNRGELSLSEIACAVGFDDQSYYTRIFKRHVGMPPGKYRANRAG